MDNLEKYYIETDIDKKFNSRIKKIEYLTVMKYIHDFLNSDSKIIEIGACTGIYSIALSKEGYQVTSVEKLQHNIDIFKSKIKDDDSIEIIKGDATNLSFIQDESFDAVLLMGPLYHLKQEERLLALKEAKRICKKRGVIFSTFCLNDCKIMSIGFGETGKEIFEWLSSGEMDRSFNFSNNGVFTYCKIEDINQLNQEVGLKRIKMVATDSLCYYLKNNIESWDLNIYNLFIKYHFSICEDQNIIGACNQLLDITQND